MTNLLLVGAPNSGKSALFNKLTGLSHKVANYPGITVDVGTGALQERSQCDGLGFSRNLLTQSSLG